MSDLEPILALWRELEASGAEYVLATVVAVEGSSYRRPGARMLIAQDGCRAGTVSGGCLEAEVAKRAWWLTEDGPVVEQFSTFEDDGERPYGSGCGGMVSLLLERKQSAAPLLRELRAAFNQRAALAVATVLEGARIGRHAIVHSPSFSEPRDSNQRDDELAPESDFPQLAELAGVALNGRASMEERVLIDGTLARVWADFRPARTGLWIFGAGDDARPLVRIARELGWFVAVADGRSHLATRERFPLADEIHGLDVAALPSKSRFDFRPTDAAVLMTHSFEQDSRVLASLLALDVPLAYVGVLGPQRRTREMLAEAARLRGIPAREEQIERWLATLHAPTGLDLGADTPASIALSILAEIQQRVSGGTAQPLRVVRAAKLEAAEI